MTVFHVELRQFPHVARVFNLSREELDARFAIPWVSGAPIPHEDRRWSPDRARITIYEGRELRPDEIGMGRGWANVGRSAREVTDSVLDEAQRGARAGSSVQAFKAHLNAAALAGALALGDVVERATREHPGWRVSDRLALAEQAVWEMLHQGTLELAGEAGALERERWETVLLEWASWTGGSDASLTLRPPA